MQLVEYLIRKKYLKIHFNFRLNKYGKICQARKMWEKNTLLQIMKTKEQSACHAVHDKTNKTKI